MIKGFLLGSASGLAVSALVVTTLILTVPLPEASTRPSAAAPSAPVQRQQSEAAPRVPDRPDAPDREAMKPQLSPDPFVPERPSDGVDVTPTLPQQAAPPVVQVITSDPEPVTEDRDNDMADSARTAGGRLDLPAASQFNRPPEDEIAVLPDTNDARRSAAAPDGLRAVAPADEVLRETQSAAQPQTSSVEGFGPVPDAGEAPAVPVARAEIAPQTFGRVPAATDAPLRTGEVASDVIVETVPAEEAPEEEIAQEEGPDDISLVEVPVVVERTETEAPPRVTETVVMPRRILLDSERGSEEGVSVFDPSPSALAAFAAPFENPGDRPLMSVVLIDDPASDIDRATLAALEFPVTFAVDPTLADAEAVAALYRAGGHDVVALADMIPSAATAQDVEVAVAAMRRAIPQAVGVLDRASDGIVSDRAALDALVAPLAEAGMGLLAYPDGLNTGVATARRGGVPAVTLDRTLDAADGGASRLLRDLNRATFNAAQGGPTVVLGRATGETIEALRRWRMERRTAEIATAPLSAVLRDLDGG